MVLCQLVYQRGSLILAWIYCSTSLGGGGGSRHRQTAIHYQIPSREVLLNFSCIGDEITQNITNALLNRVFYSKHGFCATQSYFLNENKSNSVMVLQITQSAAVFHPPVLSRPHILFIYHGKWIQIASMSRTVFKAGDFKRLNYSRPPTHHTLISLFPTTTPASFS